MAGSLDPQKLGVNDWYYEEKDNLLLVHEIFAGDGTYIRTDQIKIPWRKIKESMKRVSAAKPSK